MSEHLHIGMPVFNGESHLKEALESLLNQTHENFEIFIVDNASTDSTQAIIQYYAKLDSRIKNCRMPHWVSATENWNRTYELAAQGVRFFMWAGDDDILARDFIEATLPPLLAREEVVLSFPEGGLIGENGNIVNYFYGDTLPSGPTVFRRIQSIIRFGNYTPIYGLIKTKAIGWRPVLKEISFGADLWFLIQLAAAGRFNVIKRPLFFKRTGGISETGEDPSASHDPMKTWIISDNVWHEIKTLKISYFEKLYTFYRLRISAKSIHPKHKKLDWFLVPMYICYMLQKNPRAFGIRFRLKRFLGYNRLKC